MCGIVGYSGDKSIHSVLLVGLIRLEYRGYDSAGIAAIDQGELEIRKEKGKIKALEDYLKLHPVNGHIGIGHTRWATHGEPSRGNAHPHVDGSRKIAVVHNGIIENYMHLRHELTKKGHLFHTETDTEVIPHLLEEELKTHGTLEKAIPAAVAKLEGKFACAILYEKDPERIYFIKDGSPLIYGKGKNEGFLASDIMAIIPQAKEQCIIKDGQWGWMTRDEFHLFEKDGSPVDVHLEHIKLTVEDLEKGPYDHFMLKEIFEQPDVFRRIIEARMDEKGKVRFPEMEMSNDVLGRVGRILITSAGTSWHAGLVGKLYFEKFARIATDVDLSSEFRYRNPIAEGDTMVIGISQSGETADTLAGILEAKSKFCRVLSFVNRVDSTIARDSDAFINLMAGPEIGVASTKAYTAQLLNMLFFSLYMSGIRWITQKEEREAIFEEIRKLPVKIESILARAEEIRHWAREYIGARDFIFLGRYYNHPTALEGALKLKEISYIHASGYAGGEFKHGPIALIDENIPVVCIAPKTEVYDKMVSNIQEVKARKGKILAICTEGDTMVPDLADHYFHIPAAPDFLTPLLTVIPLQLLAYYAAIERGCEPDQPRNLAKSVTVE
ncbi:glutamine--fructose-6-phosphate transaminase (isomerizing) [Leptonema illini]|uniref:Glutamine--fructose-6-phosphate aminotransferase [isomerizing] n=1 Tax=Leptonema illini DSM 21528 TaxID=929563 RepID=H2CI35_9LEPT|nr:glutamine--fructose-6-phosphate transaminase (isomerizing) [Leptonema illini]EHQ08058.1 glutamine--fructose-6-phosphate transaminase [Leptonema illini DSM 21528]